MKYWQLAALSTQSSNPRQKEIQIRFQFLSDDYQAFNSTPKALSTHHTCSQLCNISCLNVDALQNETHGVALHEVQGANHNGQRLLFCEECFHRRLFTSGRHYSYDSWFILSFQSNLHHFLLGEVRIKLQDCVLCTFVSQNICTRRGHFASLKVFVNGEHCERILNASTKMFQFRIP